MVVMRCVRGKNPVLKRPCHARVRGHPAYEYEPMSHWAPAFAGVTGLSWVQDLTFDHSIESVSIQKNTLHYNHS